MDSCREQYISLTGKINQAKPMLNICVHHNLHQTNINSINYANSNDLEKDKLKLQNHRNHTY